MLLKSRISQIGMLEDDNVNELWRQERLGKITSSNVYKLCGAKGFGKTGMGYIDSRVFETRSRVPSETEVNTEATIHGLREEGPALRNYIHSIGIHPRKVVVQKYIHGQDPLFGCTPDGLYCMNESSDGLSWNVEVWEVKCYQVVKHMASIKAKTPRELKVINPQLYYQLLDQMINVDCLTGRAILFHPELPLHEGGLHVVPFRKMEYVNGKYPMVEDITFVKERKEMAKIEIAKGLLNPSVTLTR